MSLAGRVALGLASGSFPVISDEEDQALTLYLDAVDLWHEARHAALHPPSNAATESAHAYMGERFEELKSIITRERLPF